MTYEYKYPKADNTLDMVVFTILHGLLQVLLIKRGREGEPFYNHWALPGGFLHVGGNETEQGESLEEGAHREFTEETSLDITDVYIEQLYTFGKPGRDPRGRVITVAYYALVSPDLAPQATPQDDAKEAKWFPVDSLAEQLAADSDFEGDTLSFDHDDILQTAIDRIRGKIDYEPKLALHLVPRVFSMAQLRRVYETIQGRKYDSRNFRKRFNRMIEDGKIDAVPGQRHDTGGRPAKIYTINQEPDGTTT